jgi:ubiquinone/menaquinone biosynthesis C-methylase UbiE
MSQSIASRRLQIIYTILAPIYDLWTLLTESRSLQSGLEFAGIREGQSTLEVAVGSGVLFRELLKRNLSGRNVGLDLTQAMLSLTRRKAQRVGGEFELVRGDAQALPFAAASFDLVVNNNMLGLLPDSLFQPILGEMFRTLRPGGKLVVVLMRKPERLFAKLIFQCAVWFGGWRDVELESHLREAGFGNIRIATVVQIGIPSQVFCCEKPQ